MITLSEIDGIRRFIEDHDAKNGLLLFCAEQVSIHTRECVNHVKRADTLNAAVEAGRLDVYEGLLNELEHFVKTAKV